MTEKRNERFKARGRGHINEVIKLMEEREYESRYCNKFNVKHHSIWINGRGNNTVSITISDQFRNSINHNELID